MQIWPGLPPGSEDWTHQEGVFPDATGELIVRNVVVPTVTPYLPEPSAATGTAAIVAPGGGFEMLAINHEGHEACQWLRELGVAAFLLKYRLAYTGDVDETTRFRERIRQLLAGRTVEEVQEQGLTAESIAAWIPETRHLAQADGAQAVRFVRSRASEWGFDPSHLGFVGFSAGAYVGAAAAVQPEVDSRPAFVAAIYGGSAAAGEVPPEAPPLFCVVTTDDGLAYDPCMRLTSAWQAARRPFELHVYQQGGHGFGMRPTGLPVDSWTERLADWMRSLGFLP